MATTLAPRTARRTISLVRLAPCGAIGREQPGRRLLNLAVATVGIVLTLLLMVVMAALIKLTSREPVLFLQTRIGLDRRALSGAGGNTTQPRPGRPAVRDV